MHEPVSCSRVDALAVELRVDRVRPHPLVVGSLPRLGEPDVVLAATQRTRPMPGGESRRLVQEEELREPAGLQQRGSVPATELEPTRDPAPAGISTSDPPRCVVQASAIAVHEPSRRVRDKLAEGRDAVLERHARVSGWRPTRSRAIARRPCRARAPVRCRLPSSRQTLLRPASCTGWPRSCAYAVSVRKSTKTSRRATFSKTSLASE